MISFLPVLSFFVVTRATASPPRVIIVALGDDYGFNNVGYPHGPLNAGNKEMRTPNLDALAMSGLRLERHYVYKFCSPTRSSLLSGRLPIHVNQNNANNDARAASGIDLRMTTLPQKLKAAGNWRTAMVGKWHCGARSPANLPINRGFDHHFGFLKGGEDHFEQNHCAGGPDGKTVDLWLQHNPAWGRNGSYSAFIYTNEVLAVIRNFTVDLQSEPDLRLFIYLPWHNTHTPLEAPDSYLYPAYYNNSFPARMMYNAMAQALDQGMGNVTAALREAGLYADSLILFSADNGGWLLPEGRAGANNWPLRGGKTSDFEGGVRSVSFISGGYLPAQVRGRRHFGFVSIADWYGTLVTLAGGDPTNDHPGVPPVDSVDVWPSLLNSTNSTPRTRVPLSYYKDNQALIVDGFKIICGPQANMGFRQGPVFPNSTTMGTDPGCPHCCLFDILNDELESQDLSSERPDLFAKMKSELEEMGKGVYQTDYPEPNTTACLSDQQAYDYYDGFIGPVCFHHSPIPPTPPPPPPVPFALVRDGGKSCLRPSSDDTSIIATACRGSAHDAFWVTEANAEAGWLAWLGDKAQTPKYIKFDEHVGPNVTTHADFCIRGRLFLNPSQPPGQHHQGFVLATATGTIASTTCEAQPYRCLVAPVNGSRAHGGPCSDPDAVGWKRVNATAMGRWWLQ